jgi:hypothetical protein
MVKAMLLGVTRVRDAKAMMLKKQIEAIKFNDGKDIDNFCILMSSLM